MPSEINAILTAMMNKSIIKILKSKSKKGAILFLVSHYSAIIRLKWF